MERGVLDPEMAKLADLTTLARRVRDSGNDRNGAS